ncbi:MAG: ADP-dependent phosphofructokinase/glucokinase [Candidatus Nanohaloarchaea archaeon]|jgi:ADP-dependent phosphofructokinase/glucokinase
MKDIWTERFLNSRKLAESDYVETLTAFNANIDIKVDYSDLDIDMEGVEPENIEEPDNLGEFKSLLKYCTENGENREVPRNDIRLEVSSGKRLIGGQAGIWSNYLSQTQNSVTFYTPFLSDKLAEKVNESVLYPVMEGQFVLKNVRDSANTDRMKENIIIEYAEEKTGRLILSDNLKGFGPYFRGGVADNLGKIDQNLDRVFVSGFQNASGNIESKMKKSAEQLSVLETPIHLEYVDMSREESEIINHHIIPQVDSIGMDETEAAKIADIRNIEIDEDELSLGSSFKVGKDLIENGGLDRVHIHTYKYHVIIADEDYPVEEEKMRESMLYGEVSGITMADTGNLPRSDTIMDFNMEDKHIERLDELENFQDFFDLENFVETGIACIDELKVVAIPTIIHEDPDRLVGLGDIISAGAFVGELK